MKRKLLFAFACCLFVATNVLATTWTINVGPNGTMTFSPSSITVSLGDTVKWVWASGSHTTTSTAVPSGATTWDHPITSSSTTYTYVPAVTGSYSYKCTPHASMGMTGSFTVVACTPPSSTTIFGASSMCAGNTDTLAVPEGPGYTYAWYQNGVAVPGATSNTYAESDTSGAFTYTVVVSNGCGSDTTDPFTFVVNPLPMPAISDTVVDGTVMFSTDAIFGATYLWNFGDGTTSTDINPSHSFAMDGVPDTVTLTATSSDGCVGTTQKIITTPGLKVNILTASSEITISPNPATSQVLVNYNLPVNTASIKLIDVLGNTVYSNSLTLQHGQLSIPVKDLPAGLYMVEISAGGARYVGKVVKQ